MFHPGELAVQHRAGVEQFAARLEGMLDPPNLTGGLGRFLAGRTYAALSARDHDGTLWVSPLVGEPGFLEVLGMAKLRVHAAPIGPLHDLPSDQEVGLLVLEYAIRRRLRVNGHLVAVSPGTLDLDVTQAYGNCPQHIPAHAVITADAEPAKPRARMTLDEADRALVTGAETFVLGTTHATRGNDASHRGGPPGFVRVDESGSTLGWPDYPGNNMFNSLGNLELDPTAALLFVDFDSGRTLHVTGEAEVVWAGTNRAVVFHVNHAISAAVPASPSSR